MGCASKAGVAHELCRATTSPCKCPPRLGVPLSVSGICICLTYSFPTLVRTRLLDHLLTCTLRSTQEFKKQIHSHNCVCGVSATVVVSSETKNQMLIFLFSALVIKLVFLSSAFLRYDLRNIGLKSVLEPDTSFYFEGIKFWFCISPWNIFLELFLVSIKTAFLILSIGWKYIILPVPKEPVTLLLCLCKAGILTCMGVKTWACLVQGQELDSIVPVDPFQLRMLYGSVPSHLVQGD